MHYRRDIDGLRAVSVLSVILAHAGFSLFPGGFIGVDVFFVISGFLITKIIAREMDEGRYSIAAFYERRARRIIPALVVMIALVTPVALWLMLPDFRKSYGQSVFATLFFSNNLLLAATTGYWDLASEFKPLLHTWSLGVEEQYYIVFPIVMALVWRFGRKGQIGVILALGLISFAVSEYGWRQFPAANFYLPVSRAWELMVGSAAAFVRLVPRRGDNLLSLAGLAAILGAVLLFEPATPSPSAWLLIPVLGAAAVLLCSRPGTIVCALLSHPLAVGIGLISYSAYLWHQPLFALTRIALLDPPGPWLMALLSVLSLVCGWLSWRFVEQPFRDRRAMPLRPFVGISAAACLALAGMGLVLHAKGGFPRLTFPAMAAEGDVYISYNERIRSRSTDAFPGDLHGNPAGGPNVALFGNSFGRDVGNILIEAGLERTGALVYQPLEPAAFCQPDQVAPVRGLLERADVVVLAFQNRQPASAAQADLAGLDCLRALTSVPVVVFGSKSFGFNLNPFGRVPVDQRAEAMVRVPAEESAFNDRLRAHVPPEDFVDLLALLGPTGADGSGTDSGGEVHVFDADGNPLSPDRLHLTRYGATFAASRLMADRPDIARLLHLPPAP